MTTKNAFRKAPHLLFTGLALCGGFIGQAFPAETALTNAVPGLSDPNQATIIFQGHFPSQKPEEKEDTLIFSTRLLSRIRLAEKVTKQTDALQVTVIQGKLKELSLRMEGQGEVLDVTGPGLLDWGIRRATNGQRFLVIHTEKGAEVLTNYSFNIQAALSCTNAPFTVVPLVFSPEDASLFSGFVEVDPAPVWEIGVTNLTGLTPIEPKFFPGAKPRSQAKERRLAFRFSGAPYGFSLLVAEADPDLRKIRFRDFRLEGQVDGEVASFTLRATAVVRHPEGGEVEALSGGVALTAFTEIPEVTWHLQAGRYRITFRTNGVFSIQLAFDARIQEENGWKKIAFTPLASALRPVVLRGFPETTELQFQAAAEAQWKEGTFLSYLPAAGPLELQWQTARPEVEGKLFFAVTAAAQVAVSPGLIRQTTAFDYKVMQGELQDLHLNLEGEGEVTRVQGEGILSWRVEPLDPPDGRRLTVRLNQARKDTYTVSVETQTPLGAFPLKLRPLRLVPDQAIRYGGHIRVVNEGAVRLEVLNAPGLAQISPARFPESKALGDLTQAQQAQAFAFRFSGPQFDLEIQADTVLPELTVSELLLYHLGETESTMDAEWELEIREAPLREFEVLVPSGYSIALLNAPHLGDRNLGTPDANGAARLTLQFTKPLIGRQVIQLRLTRSHAAPDETWVLFPLKPQKVKAIRGFVGLAADAGLRLIETEAQGVTEIATAFFPKKVKDLQLAYRLRDEAWAATVRSERLALSIQVDSLHLFSIGEGLTYGSTVLNYLIAGAPVSSFKLQIPSNYANVEFVGRDIRDWKPSGTEYEVHLHSPVSGTYSLLATFELQFDPRGEELLFNGVQPLEVQSEQGYIVAVSTYQYQTNLVEVTSGLIPIEPGEIPTEYRLLLDAPILSAYQFTGRPFDMRLKLTSLDPGDTVNQVVDRAAFSTHVSGEGQAVTDIQYWIKSQGYSHLRLEVPEETTLWSARVNGEEVVPVTDQQATLLPVPQNLAPNAIIPVELILAVKSEHPSRITIALPRIQSAPLLVGDWQMQPDEGYRLDFLRGSVTPLERPSDISGFAWMTQMLRGQYGDEPVLMLWSGVVLLLIGAGLCRWATGQGMHRFSLKNWAGAGLGFLSILMALGMWLALIGMARAHPLQPSFALAFTVPFQTAGDSVEVLLKNRSITGMAGMWLAAWPVYLGLIAWGYFLLAKTGLVRLLGVALGWTLVFWGCLRLPNGGVVFLGALTLFGLVQVLLPLGIRQGGLPRKIKPPRQAPAAEANGATALLLLACWIGFEATLGAAPRGANKEAPVLLQSITQTARVKEERVFLSANLTWEGRAGQSLDFLRQPGVLTTIQFPQPDLKLVQETVGEKTVYRLTAQNEGVFEVRFDYELPLERKDALPGFHLPTHHGLINRLSLALDRAQMELVSPQAVSIRPVTAPGEESPVPTRFDLVLAPVQQAWISWRPRSRDTRTEKSVFYTELFQLFIPTAGIIEGVHEVHVRPAQGQVHELLFQTPEGMTITDVQAQGLAGWRFDPDNRRVRAQFDPPQSRAFSLRLLSQITSGPLPFEKEVGVIRVEQAAGQVGMVGIATGSDVQLEEVTLTALTPINLEDFPSAVLEPRAKEISGLTVRRAFRATEEQARVTLKAAAVRPDVQVVDQQTLSLGEDRSVLAVKLQVAITRAGVFKLSFALPEGMDVESLTGQALSHWTELKTDEERIITMHLQGKTEGQHEFSVNLAGPGVPAGAGWAAPRLVLREASKQTGQLVVVPEQGMRLQIAVREGLTQSDPKSAGIRQQGVLVFHLLQRDWRLSFDVEKVDPWVQVVSLQDVTIREGQVKVTTTFDYTIENAGLKSLFVQLPVNADSVRFFGNEVADAIKADQPAGETVEWEIKLHRRIIGAYQLQVSYQVPAEEQTVQETIAGVQARQVNLQRGYLTLRSSGRLQLSIPRMPPALQPVDWRSIPGPLRVGPSANEGNFTFRAVEPDYRLTCQIIRHDAARLLRARVEKTELISMLSDSGEILTEVRLTMQPGEKRLLRLKLPQRARFWFAFVNNAGVRPWQETNTILIPVEQNFKPDQPALVEFLYSLSPPSSKGRTDDFALIGPEFDVPLENITWNVCLPPNRELDDWDGELQLQEERVAAGPVRFDLRSYLHQETSQQKQQTEEAESMLQLANNYLSQGYQQQARRAFRSAWSLSQYDDAFNEDARVQLHNLKMQQALVGLNYRRNAVFQDQLPASTGATNAALNLLKANQPARYSQQEVKQALELNSAEDNSTLMLLAEHLIQQQDAAQVAPETIRASLPELGNRLTFTRSILVDPWAVLRLNLETQSASRLSRSSRFGLLLGLFAASTGLILLARSRRG